MTLIVITGPLSVGKTTVQNQLADAVGAFVVPSYTSRTVEHGERDVIHCPVDELMARAQAGELIAPMYFGTSYYAWNRYHLEHYTNVSDLAVLNARPYTTLLLNSLLPNCIAVMLDAPEPVLRSRRRARAAIRDKDDDAALRQEQDDIECRAYRPLFRTVIRSDDLAAQAIVDTLLD
jgi:guanylate kinase